MEENRSKLAYDNFTTANLSNQFVTTMKIPGAFCKSNSLGALVKVAAGMAWSMQRYSRCKGLLNGLEYLHFDLNVLGDGMGLSVDYLYRYIVADDDSSERIYLIPQVVIGSLRPVAESTG